MIQKVIHPLFELCRKARAAVQPFVMKRVRWLLSMPQVQAFRERIKGTLLFVQDEELHQRRQQLMGIMLGLAFLYALYALILNFYVTPPDVTAHISTAPVKVEDRNKILKLPASVVVISSVALKARLDSQIVKIKVKSGNTVKQGDLLVELDDTLIKAQIAQAEATIRHDKSEVVRAELQFTRDSKLVKNGIISQGQYDKSKQTQEFAKTDVERSEASLKILQTQLEFTKIRAPIAGVVGIIPPNEGDMVKAYDTNELMTINQMSPIYVRIPIPQQHYADIKEALNSGALKAVARDKDDKILGEGKISHKDNKIDEKTRTFFIDGIFENKDESLWPNMFVNADVILGQYKEAKTIPLVAVRKGQKGDYVFVVHDDKVKQVPIRTIDVQEDTAIIEGDISEGDRVAINNFMNLSDGALVTLSEKNQIPENSSSKKSSDAPLKSKRPAEEGEI